MLDHRAWRAVVHGELPGWNAEGQGRERLQETFGVLPGDSALSGLDQPAQISIYRAAAGTDLQIHNALQVLNQVGAVREPPELVCRNGEGRFANRPYVYR